MTEKGLVGEELVGGDLARLLAGSGCVIVNSLRFLGFGDIDHLVIGPGGITVIDAKNWSGAVTVGGQLPRVEGWTKPKEVEKLQRQLAGVRLALLHARPELRSAALRGVMCLAAEPDRPATALEDGLALSGSSAAAEIAARPGTLSEESVVHLRDVLTEQVPRITRHAVDELLRPPPPSRAIEPARPTAQRNGRDRHGRRIQAGRSRRSQRRGWSGALVTIAAAAVAWWGLAHLRFVAPETTGTVSQLTLARHDHRLSIRYTAIAGDTVRLIVRGAGRTRRVTLSLDGRRGDCSLVSL